MIRCPENHGVECPRLNRCLYAARCLGWPIGEHDYAKADTGRIQVKLRCPGGASWECGEEVTATPHHSTSGVLVLSKHGCPRQYVSWAEGWKQLAEGRLIVGKHPKPVDGNVVPLDG